MNPKSSFIRIGDFFFKWRNYIVPSLLVLLFLSFPTPTRYWGMAWLEETKDLLALFIVVSGLAFRLATIGWVYIKRGGMDKKVYADRLVTTGFFGLCRNPLYVGNMLIYSGIFLVHGHPVVIVFGTAFFFFLYSSIIAAEEFYLHAHFGQEYADYCAHVPRWMPDFSRYREATATMEYSFRQAIFKDVMTIFNTFTAISLIELIEHYLFYPREMFWLAAPFIFDFMTFLIAGLMLVRFLKKADRRGPKQGPISP
ncbi:MAG: phospholipid methyltransferase [Gammaproteobacteria bacterium HGW-Gammaproteobacteria-3]|nr:MAG: phospholipid methyltransferase [Gammaproteobacteria bacterium HGW-Gammaproteobacteria-3]